MRSAWLTPRPSPLNTLPLLAAANFSRFPCWRGQTERENEHQLDGSTITERYGKIDRDNICERFIDLVNIFPGHCDNGNGIFRLEENLELFIRGVLQMIDWSFVIKIRVKYIF